MNLNGKQIVLIVLAMLSFTATGIQQLEPVIGLVAVKAVGSIATFVGGLMAAAMAPFLSNASVVKDASNTTGVEPLRINRDASPAIAALALDPKIDNVAPKTGDTAAVQAKAGETSA